MSNVRKPNLTTRDLAESLGKLPPQALDLEEAILGAALLERDGQLIALEKMDVEDFYEERNKEVFAAIKALADAGSGIDMRTVRAQLIKTGRLELIGGPYRIVELTSTVSSAANIAEYCHVVKEKRIARDIILFASMLHAEAYNDTTDVLKLVQKISEFPTQLMKSIKTDNIKNVAERVVELGQEISKRTESKPEITGIPTGYISLDNITRGWQNTDLIIIAARPSMGKTTFLLNCLTNAATIWGAPVGLFSLEMSFNQLSDKVISIETDIGMRTLHDKVFEKVEWDRYMEKTKPLTKAKILIDDTPAISITELRTSGRKLKEQFGIKLLAVDYIQLMKGPLDKKGGTREQEISSISGGLKQLAKELGIPVIALSQLSRKVEERGGDKRPILADLRESGAIEQDADIIAFLWRPAYYKITGEDGFTYINGLTKIIIAKHRNGPLGEPSVAMEGSTSKFRSIDSPYMEKQKVEEQPKWMELQSPLTETPNTNDDDSPF